MIKIRIMILVVLFGMISITNINLSHAVEKTWTGAGDGFAWFDDSNWFPTIVPTSSDNAVVNENNASLTIDQTFETQSIAISGKFPSTININNFVYGTVDPGAGTLQSILNRKDGKIILRGAAGRVTLAGQYLDSEQPLIDQPGFTFLLE